MTRKILGYTFSFSLALEGLGSMLVHALKIPANQNSTTIWSHSTMRYGAVNIFAAALLVMVSSAIHLRTPLFNMAFIIKLIYLLFNISSSIFSLVAPTSTGALRAWVAVRTATALILLGNDIGELVRSRQQPLGDIPGWNENDPSSSSSEASSAGSEYSSHESERSR
jgi:hypothetical protein